ncbi:hypothetical protein O6H91_12G060100 [Diphasiastrum complanatum]|uniref:Uncharacterized protein n=1 Tax=Diphasiastrum complanatum TaxID=34168 RepID=A0ACC2C2D8_DIPCM|nr:hypothetical protein O6H91_12G060100 [Diphasiastrum complanatum]
MMSLFENLFSSSPYSCIPKNSLHVHIHIDTHKQQPNRVPARSMDLSSIAKLKDLFFACDANLPMIVNADALLLLSFVCNQKTIGNSTCASTASPVSFEYRF